MDRPAPTATLPRLAMPQATEAVLDRLLRHLNVGQLETLVEALDRVQSGSGYGDVVIVMEKGFTRRVRFTLSVDITPKLIK